MRKFMDVVLKGNRLTEEGLNVTVDLKDKTELKPKIDLAEPSSLGALSAQRQNTAVADPQVRSTNQAGTAAAVKMPQNLGHSQAHMAHLMQQDLGQDIISDEEVLGQRIGHVGAGPDDPPPTEPETLPDIIRDFTPKTVDDLPDVLDQAGIYFYPEFHKVPNLPAYIYNNVRVMARMLWKIFAEVNLDEVTMMSTLTNKEDVVKMMMAWVKKNGVLVDKPTIDFSHFFGHASQYQPDVQLWQSMGYDWLLVHDNVVGDQYYIYVWVGGRGVHVGTTPTQQLESKHNKKKLK